MPTNASRSMWSISCSSEVLANQEVTWQTDDEARLHMEYETDIHLRDCIPTSIEFTIPTHPQPLYSSQILDSDHPVPAELFWTACTPNRLSLLASHTLISSLIHPKVTYWNDIYRVRNGIGGTHYWVLNFRVDNLECKPPLATLGLPKHMQKHIENLINGAPA